MRSYRLKALLAVVLAAGLLALAGPGWAGKTYNRSSINSLFKQAYGNCNRLRALGYNPSQIENKLRWAQRQLNNYWSNPSRFNTLPRTTYPRYNNKELQTINPFGDYVFHGTNIRNHGGKLQTRSLDPTGIVARAQEWAKELHGITQKAEVGKSAEFKQNINQALAFLGSGPAIPTTGSLGQQADAQIGALRGDGGGAPEAPAAPMATDAGGGQFSNPYAGDSSVVDLRDSKTLTPSLLREPESQGETTTETAPAVPTPPAPEAAQATGGSGVSAGENKPPAVLEPGAGEKAESLYARAMDSLDRGDQQSAIRDLREAVKLLPLDAKLRASVDQALARAGGKLPPGFAPTPQDSQALLPAVVAAGKSAIPTRPPSGKADPGLAQARAQTARDQAAKEQSWVEYQKQLFAARQAEDQKLAHMLSQQKAPPLPGGPTREVKEGVFLGLTNTQYQANQLMAKGTSPVSGRPYAEMLKEGEARAYGFGNTDVTAMELMRGARDAKSKGAYTLDQEHFQNLLPQISGTHYEVLNAHSNGATIAEALLRQGTIRADELNILGGDRALSRINDYQALLDNGTVQKVTVWVNRGDPVPYLSNPRAAVLQDNGLPRVRPAKPGGPVVEYHLFGDRQEGWSLKEYHPYEQYEQEMARTRRRQQAARSSGGAH